MHILAISGSLRRDSINTLVVGSLQQLAPDGMEIDIFKGLGAVPPYNEDLDVEPPPLPIAALAQAIREADGLFWAMPEFNHSIPGVLKNAIDWLTHPLSKAVLMGKPCAIAVATQGRGGFRGMADLARILRDLGNFVVPAPEVCIQFAHTRVRVGANGAVEYLDKMTEDLLRILLRSLKRTVEQRLGDGAAAAWRDTLEYMSNLVAKSA